MSFGENLQTIRKKNHLSQEALAEIVIQDDHDQNCAKSKHQIDRAAIIRSTAASCAIVNANAYQAESECHYYCTCNIRLEQDLKLFLEADPYKTCDYASYQACTCK